MLVAFEGIDGSGKATQAQKLYDRVIAERDSLGGKVNHCELRSYPRYDSYFGEMIKRYLAGEFGGLDEVPPYLVSLLYSLDRFHDKTHRAAAARGNNLLICDRYVASNVAHQAGKLLSEGFAKYLALAADITFTEYIELGVRCADCTFLLDITAKKSWVRSGKRGERDIHEEAPDYLKNVRQAYLDMARSEDNWHVVNCFDQDRERSVDEIHDEIWKAFLNELQQRTCSS